MADINAALYARMSGHAGLAALVGSRIYPVRMPQGVTLPAVTYQQVGARGHWTGGADAPVDALRYQVSAWGGDIDQARAVAAQIRAALRRWGGTAASTVVQGIFWLTEFEAWDDPSGSFAVHNDFEVHYDTA